MRKAAAWCEVPLSPAARGRSLLKSAGAVLLAITASSLAGCAVLDDAGEGRMCRSLIPAFSSDATAIRVLTTQRLTDGHGVRVLYRADLEAGESQLRTVTCTFKPRRDGAALTSRDLIGVATEDGALGDLRLHILKSFWLDRAGAIDPAPILYAERVPHIPRTAAVALQSLLAALPQMAVYALLATSYALIYGLVGRINLAFGDFATLGGYGAFLALVATGGSGLLVALTTALLAAGWTAAVHGGLAGRLVFRPIVQQRGQVALIASVGLAIFIAEYIRIAQGPGMRWTPPLLDMPVGLARAGQFVVAATPMALTVTLIALGAAAGLLVLMRRSRFGRAWRACADDPLAAALMGLSPSRILMGTFVLASLTAGLGGAITTLHYGGIMHSGGLLVGLKALIAAILGGAGSLPGAFAGGLALGAAEALWSAAFPIELRDPAIYALLVIVLAIRPGGIRGTPDLDPRRG